MSFSQSLHDAGTDQTSERNSPNASAMAHSVDDSDIDSLFEAGGSAAITQAATSATQQQNASTETPTPTTSPKKREQEEEEEEEKGQPADMCWNRKKYPD